MFINTQEHLERIKSVERFSDCLRVLIHCLMPTFHEHCSSLHQDEKQTDTVSILKRISVEVLKTFRENFYN